MTSLLEKELEFIKSIDWLQSIKLRPSIEGKVWRHAAKFFDLLELKKQWGRPLFSINLYRFTWEELKKPDDDPAFFKRDIEGINNIRKRTGFNVAVPQNKMYIVRKAQQSAAKKLSKYKHILGKEYKYLLKTAFFDIHGAIACAFYEIPQLKNPFHQFLSIWKFGFYPVGPVYQTISPRKLNMFFYFVPKK
jgi:hypothetical protein